MNGSSGLIGAVEAGDLQSVRALLDQGADMQVTSNGGMTPLHLAAFLGHRDIVATLVSAGADVDVRDRFERTPLHHAAFDGHESVVVYLLLHDADPEARSENGHSAFELAALQDHRELAVLLGLASNGNLEPARTLARYLTSSPTNPSKSADRRVVTALLQERDIDIELEPLVTSLLQEIRRDPPPRRYRTAPRRMVRARVDQTPERVDEVPPVWKSSGSRRAARFLGIPPESVGTPESVGIGRSWTVSGLDPSVLTGEVDAFEDSSLAMFVNEGGQFRQVTESGLPRIINKAVLELDRIAIEGSVSALDLFNKYFRRLGQSTDLPDFHRTLQAALMLYTDDRFFRILNERWRSNRSRELLGFSTLMSMAFRHAKYFMEDEAYRGVDLTDIDHYEPGLVFRWPFFISASTNRNVAAEFGKTLVTIEVPGEANVREIAYTSLFPQEGEVLFRAYEVFEVLEASPEEIRIRVFYDEFFGIGMEISEDGEVLLID